VVGVHFSHKPISDPNQLAVLYLTGHFLIVAGICAADANVLGIDCGTFTNLLFLFRPLIREKCHSDNSRNSKSALVNAFASQCEK
jgi:hypothetical protein